jgi:hypothetical protein
VEYDDSPPGAKFPERALRAERCEVTRAFVVYPAENQIHVPPLRRITEAYGIDAVHGYPPALQQDWADAPAWLHDRLRGEHSVQDPGRVGVHHREFALKVMRAGQWTADRLANPANVHGPVWRTCP